jgi:hypothetical protein
MRAGSDTAAAGEVADRLDERPAHAIEHSGGVTSYDPRSRMNITTVLRVFSAPLPEPV